MIEKMTYADLASLVGALATGVNAGLMSREQATAIWKYSLRIATNLVQLPPYGKPEAKVDEQPKAKELKK